MGFPGGTVDGNLLVNAGVQSLVREDSIYLGATKPFATTTEALALGHASHNCWATVSQLLNLSAAATEAWAPRACAFNRTGNPSKKSTHHNNKE